MIVGTAGHIDHGKTSLVKALTGVDTDRLKEEKARGITLDLGFAYLAPDVAAKGAEAIGFVDVPGHEKLVRHMLAGATGIDHVLLVIAADDGPMPQTREHLAILDLLGLGSGAVVLNKADLATPERLKALASEVRILLAESSLAASPILSVSATTGAGMEALNAHLRAVQEQRATTDSPADAPGAGTPPFRLAVDRSFTLAGIGTIVTGTAVAGQVRVGDRLWLTPRGRELRVRGLHAHNRVAEHGHAGQRLALNLAGVEHHEIQRGDWIVAASAHAPTQRIDARLRVLPGEAKALAHWTPVHLHLGAIDVGARVVGLEGASLAPGDSALVQLHLDRPIGALHGDRFILRDQSALRTVGGGRVVDPFPPPSRRRRAQRLAALRALEQPDPREALQALLNLEQPQGLAWHGFVTARNLAADTAAAMLAGVPHRLIVDEKVERLFTSRQIEAFDNALRQTLATHHQKAPDSPGLTLEALHRGLPGKPGEKPSTSIFGLLLRELLKGGSVLRTGAHLHLREHEATLQGTEKQLWERLKPWLDEGGNAPPKLSDMRMRDKNLRRDQVLRVLQRLERMGKVHAVGAEYYIQTRHVLALAEAAQRLAQADPDKRLNLKALRTVTGMSRHLSEPLVEFFDRVGFTQRDAVGRHIKRDPQRMFGEGDIKALGGS
jgi:selenocysteine-specific elongation factor